MALSLVAASAWVSSTSAVTPGLPSGTAINDLVVITLVSKYDDAVLASNPAGWDSPGTPAVNSGRSAGNDNGNLRMRTFYKVWQSGDSMPSLAPTPNNVSTVKASTYRSTSGLYDVVAMPMADSTTGTPLAVTTAAVALAVNDHLLTDMAVNGDVVTWSTTTVTAPSITFGSITTPTADLATTTGTDMRMRAMNRIVSAGTASSAVTVSTALGGTTTNAVGVVNVVRIRESVPVTHNAAVLMTAPSTLTVNAVVGDFPQLSYIGQGTALGSGNSISVRYPNGITVDSAVFLVAAWKFSDNTPPSLGSDWTLVKDEIFGAGADGTGVGTLRVALWQKTNVLGTENSSTTPINVIPVDSAVDTVGRIFAYSKGSGSWDFEFSDGNDTTTAFETITLPIADQLSQDPFDKIIALVGINDADGFSDYTFSTSGHTYTPYIERFSLSSLTGSYLTLALAEFDVNTDGAAGFSTLTATTSSSPSPLGGAVVIRMREVIGGPAVRQGAVSMTAPSTLTTAATKTTAGTVSMTTPSTLTSAAVRTTPAVVSMTAPSTLTSAATVSGGPVTYQGAVSMTAPSTLTAAAVKTQLAASAMSAASTLTVAATRTTGAAVAMTATSVLTANATVAPPVVWGTYRTHGSYRENKTYRSQVPITEYSGTVTMTAPSTLSVAATVIKPAAVTMTAPSTLTANAIKTRFATVAMTAPSVLTSAATRSTSAAVSMAASSTLSAAAVRSTASSVAMTATSTLTVAGIRTTFGTVSMSAASVLTVSGFKTTAGSVNMTAPSVLTATALAGTDSYVSMTVPSVLTVGATKATVGTVNMTAPSVLTTAGVRTVSAVVAMQAASTLAAMGVRTTFAAIAMTAPSVLTSDATRIKLGGVNMTAPSALTIGAVRTTTGIVSMIVPSVLSAGAIKTQPASVSMTAASVLVAAAIRTRLAAVAMTTPSTLNAGAIPIRLATVFMTAVSTLLASASAYTATGSPFWLYTGTTELPLAMTYWNGTAEEPLDVADVEIHA